MKAIKKMFRKLKDQKGEVSVEWALVAVIMALVIAAVFNGSINAGLNTAVQTINNKLTAAS